MTENVLDSETLNSCDSMIKLPDCLLGFCGTRNES